MATTYSDWHFVHVTPDVEDDDLKSIEVLHPDDCMWEIQIGGPVGLAAERRCGFTHERDNVGDDAFFGDPELGWYAARHVHETLHNLGLSVGRDRHPHRDGPAREFVAAHDRDGGRCDGRAAPLCGVPHRPRRSDGDVRRRPRDGRVDPDEAEPDRVPQSGPRSAITLNPSTHCPNEVRP